MKTTLLFVATAMLLALASPSIAQRKKGFNDSTAVIVFSESTTKKKHKAGGENNIIKIAPLGFVSGTFPLLYERSITDFFSVQVSGGLTARNYARGVFAKESNSIKYAYPWGTDASDEAERIYSFDYRKAKLGYMLSVQPRFYFDSEGLEGSFLGLSFDHYKYKFEIPSFMDDGSGSGFKHQGDMRQEYEDINDFMVHFGYQTLNDRITFEYSTALGIRNIKGMKYAATTDYSSGTGTFIDGMAAYKQTALGFNIGIKVGYHF